MTNRTDLNRYDVILIDIKLPELSGDAIYDYMRQLPDDMSSKVLFVTCDAASAATHEITEITRRTGRPVLTKPFTLEELTEAIHRFGSE